MPCPKLGLAGTRQFVNGSVFPMLICSVPLFPHATLVLAPQLRLSNHHGPDPVAVIAARRQSLQPLHHLQRLQLTDLYWSLDNGRDQRCC